MSLRSLLFVPADSERKLAKGLQSAADALILDLEDAVAPEHKPTARSMAAEFLASEGQSTSAALYVRVNPLNSGMALQDLAAVVRPGLAGIMLPKTTGAHDIVRMAHYLDALEAAAGMPHGQVSILPVATETPQALLNMQGFATGPLPRLAGVTWGAEDLSAAIGATSNRDGDGSYAPLYIWAGALCLCAAASAGVAAIDTLYANFRDAPGLATACSASRRRGYSGRIAIHPDQVDTINTAYSPSDQEIAQARRVVDAFAQKPGAGTLSLDGVMYDMPHLKQARRTLGMLD